MYWSDKSPPKVIHHHRPTNYQAVGKAAIKNTSVGKPHAKLFEFYANCSSGFQPALAYIEKSIEINRQNISRYRKALAKAGLILYTGDKGNIIIDWDIVGQIAQTENYLYKYTSIIKLISSSKPDKRSYTLRDVYAGMSPDDIQEFNDFYKYQKIPCAKFTLNQKHLLKFMSELPDDQYDTLVSTFPEKEDIYPFIHLDLEEENQKFDWSLSDSCNGDSVLTLRDFAYPTDLPF